MNVTDDLFGGLPAVANAENAPASAASTIIADLPAPIPGDDAEKTSEKRKGGTSLVRSLGSAGTTMVSVYSQVFQFDMYI